jgi:dihydropteroate synthase
MAMKTAKTLVMGILNVTPDSFSDGGKFFRQKDALKQAEQMVSEGADIIDIGGESTRPGSDPVPADEELKRVLPVIKTLKKQLPENIKISIDTYKSSVAEQALQAGADMVNSMGGTSFDEKMSSVIAKFTCPFIIYHIKGQPKSMQKDKIVYDDVVKDVSDFFQEQINVCEKRGVKKEQIILDPGIGFGKTIEHNIELIKRLTEFKKFGVPILIGVSRKSHLGMILKEKLHLEAIPDASERLEASLAETAVAVLNGASIVRTHDVLETKKFLTVLDYFKKND